MSRKRNEVTIKYIDDMTYLSITTDNTFFRHRISMGDLEELHKLSGIMLKAHGLIDKAPMQTLSPIGPGSQQMSGIIKPCVACGKYHIPGSPCDDVRKLGDPQSTTHGKQAVLRHYRAKWPNSKFSVMV